LAFKSNVAEKWGLVIDDLEGMRSQLRMSLYSAGFAKLHVVSCIRDALERMANNRYDVILCDYALGDGTDGQQFLEYLHANDLISRNTIFVMITAEQEYKKVVAASECAPDDYVLKPFTAAEFNARLEKLLERQEFFSIIDEALDTKNWGRVLVECDKKLASKDKYFIDLCKIKCSALMRLNRSQDAANLYSEILALRSIGWAKLGLARAIQHLDKTDEAKKLTQEIMEETPHFMAAYDFMGKILAASGDKHAALDVLQKAYAVSPGTMSRVRELSYLAVCIGKPEIAEEAMQQALQRHKYSPVCQASDYAVLTKALINQGKLAEALTVVADAQKCFKDSQSMIVLFATECLAHTVAGNPVKAATALAKAMSFGDMRKLPVSTAIALADACLASVKKEEARKLLRQAIQNNQDVAIRNRGHDLLTSSGSKDATEAGAMIEGRSREVIQLGNEGVASQLEEAIVLMCQTVERTPIEEDPYYVRLVADMVDRQLIVAFEDIYTADNSKLISMDTVISGELWGSLLKHQLLKPIEQSLIIKNGVTAGSLASDVVQLTEKDHRILHLVSSSGDPAALFKQLAGLSLSPQMAFKLTVTKEQQPSLYHHTLLVTLISQYLALGSGLPEKELPWLLYAALFHDVGELHVDPAMLNLKRQLSDIEWHHIYTHPIIGYLIVLEMSGLDRAVPIAILQHQERLDGSGYPSGLRGAQIGRLSRIISVADACASILVHDEENEHLSNFIRLNTQKYEPQLISILYRGFAHLTTEINQTKMSVLPQFNAVASLVEKWSKFHSIWTTGGRNDLPGDIEFLFERMVNLRSKLLQFGFDPNSMKQLDELAAGDPMVARELTEALYELNWQFKDLEREYIRRGEISSDSPLNPDENNLLNGWMQELHAYLATQSHT
jgi:HD-GYP domain-containing protein (c-di-GMP phosphodiesterase class II)/DNA-binding response OmpR family regulator